MADLTSSVRIRAPRLLQPLGQPQFALLWSGQTVSRVGDIVYATVLTWTVYAISGSPAAAGTTLTAFSIPQLILLLAGGVIGDRLPRRSVLLVADGVSGISVGAVAVLAASGHLTIPGLIVLSAIQGTVSAFFLPAYRPLIADIVPQDRLQAANALGAMTETTTGIVAPSLAAVIYTVGRAALAFGFDAVTFFIAAVTSFALRIPNRPLAMRGSVWQDIQAGWQYIRRTTWLWLSILLASFYHVISGAPFLVLLPAILRQLHLGIGFLGLTFTLWGAAGLLCNLVLGHVRTLPRRGIFLYGGWSLLGLATLLIGIAQSYPLIGLAGMLVGAGLGSETIWSTLVQQRVPAEYMSRVVSLDMLGSFALRPLGLAGAGFLASAIGPRPVLIAGGIAGFLIFALGAFLPAIRNLD
jgi:MFS family permease